MYLAAKYPHDDVLHLNIHTVIDLHTLNVDHTIAVVIEIPLHISGILEENYFNILLLVACNLMVKLLLLIKT